MPKKFQFTVNKDGILKSNDETLELINNEVTIKYIKTIRGEGDSDLSDSPRTDSCTIKIKFDKIIPLDSIRSRCKTGLVLDKISIKDDGLCGDKYNAEGIFLFFVSCPEPSSYYSLEGKVSISSDCTLQ